MDKMLGLEPGF